MNRHISVLVVAEDAGDAALLRELLEKEFEDIHILVERGTSPEESREHAADVLVLAFRKLPAAEEFYLGFYRRAEGAGIGRHGTIVLCTREEARHAYQLCRRGLFDDYVVFWPASADITRFAMAVHTVIRALELQGRVPEQPPIPATARNTGGVVTEAPAPTGRAHVRVLVVDDDPAQRKLIGRLLEHSDIELSFASSGVEALRSITHSVPALVLLDLRMPEIDGVEVLRRLRALPGGSELPVVIVTGSADRESVRATLDFGVVDFLVKPFDRATLLGKVRRALGEVGAVAAQESSSAKRASVES